MADISALGQLNPVEMLDLDNYADAKEAAPLPRKGEYTVQAPPSFPSTAYGRSKANALTVQIDPTIVAPSNTGYQLRFTKVSGKVYKRQGVPVSQIGDYLRACGIRGRFTDEQSLADAVELTANRQYKVAVDWRAYNKNNGFSVEGMENFPSDGQGGHLPWIEDPQDKDENGEPVRLRANLFIQRYIAG